jgi:zinc and cadmium transporter
LAPAPPDERRPVAPADVMHGLETAAFRAGPVAAATTFLGLTIHTLAGGVALASAISSEQYQVGWAGLAVFLALLLHKPADSMTIATLLLASGSKRSHVHWVNALFALAVPVGALIYVGAEAFLLAAETLWARTIAGAALGFSCGTFLSISLADLLPELHFHRHDRVLLSGALLAGVALMYASARVAH